MKMDRKVESNELTFTNDSFTLSIDIATGEVTSLESVGLNIHQVRKLVTKARTDYNKFLLSKEAENFI